MCIRISVCLRSKAPRTAFFFAETSGKPQTRCKGLKSSSRPFSARFAFFAFDRCKVQFIFIPSRPGAYQSCADTTYISCSINKKKDIVLDAEHKTTVFERKISHVRRDATGQLSVCVVVIHFDCAGGFPYYLRRVLRLRGWWNFKSFPSFMKTYTGRGL